MVGSLVEKAFFDYYCGKGTLKYIYIQIYFLKKKLIFNIIIQKINF